MILLIGGEKGGTGKTTLSTNLAAVRAAAGRDVILVDTDPQGSASFWAAVRDESDAPRVACVRLQGKGIAAQLRDLAARYQDVIVDAGGRDSVELRAAMTAAQRMIIPIQASQFDTWTLEGMAQLVEQASAINPELTAGCVINRASTNPRVSEADEARELIAEYDGLSLLPVLIRDRKSYRDAARDGLSVVELGGDSKAADEIQQLYREVYHDETETPA